MHPLKNWSEIHITKLAITSWPIWWDLVYSWRRQWQLTPILLPGKSHGQRSPLGCSPWGCFESDTTERLHFHFSLSCIGEGNGNPLQCSCLENPRDGGAWWAAVSGAAQSDTTEVTQQQQQQYIHNVQPLPLSSAKNFLSPQKKTCYPFSSHSSFPAPRLAFGNQQCALCLYGFLCR